MLSHGRIPQALGTRGVILTRLGRHAEAIVDLNESLSGQPSAVVRFYLAAALQKVGRVDEARQDLETARRAGLDPGVVPPSEVAALETLLKL